MYVCVIPIHEIHPDVAKKNSACAWYIHDDFISINYA